MSVKRVFAIIGIVVGCITAFVGGVIGVMALMGKFKTPVVKPEKLYFENPEQVVVAQYKDDEGKDVIYSFNLKAENNSIDHEVNVKECFIWFEKGVGEELIQLCDKDGNLLTADSKKRYAVNCNETLYFKIKVFYDRYEYDSSTWSEDCKKLFIIQDGKYVLNESEEYDSSLIYYTMQTYEEKYASLDLSNLINGKVVLRARTADDTVQTSQDLVVWVDRNVSSIFLNYGDVPALTNNPNKEQRINIGVDKEVEFNYVVNPEISLQPISKESKKIVELYYNDSKSEDFVLVNLENIKNTTKYSLHKIFDETKCYVDELTGELKLTFLSSDATNGIAHYFKIAIFPSYNARAEFLADENNFNITNVERLQHMVTTDLYVQVVNINIDKVTLSDGELNLNLFTEDNDVYLRNEDGESLNLNVEMFAGNEKLEVRFNELDFNTITSNLVTTSPKFVLETMEEVDVKEINFAECSNVLFNKETNQLSFKINEKDFVCLIDSTISIGDYAIINELIYESKVYKCNNGVALVYIGEDNNATTIKMLEVGSYFEFYIYDNTTQTYALATEDDIKYSVTPSGQYSNKQWNIVIQSVSNEITDGTKSLVLGLLVTNNEGKFNEENLFATKPVSINVQDLHYTIKNSTAILNLVATKDGFEPNAEFGEIDFGNFIEITEGTYNTCLFVISEKEIKKDAETGKHFAIVDYIENLFYVDTKETLDDASDDEKFYVVGYFDEVGNFINCVRTRENSNVTKETAENKLQVLQLKNLFDESASGVISRLIKDIDINANSVDLIDNVQGLFKTNISVKQNLLVQDDVEFSVLVDDSVDSTENPAELYTGTSHTVKITTPSYPEIVTRLCEFYGIVKLDNSVDINYILNNYPQNANIIGRLIKEEGNNALEITLNIGEILSNDVNVEIKLANVFTGARTEETLYSFKIKNSAPEKIVYNGKKVEDDAPILITLSDNQASAPVVTAEITWDDGYIEKWYINYGTAEQQEIYAITLNNEISGSEADYFQDSQFKVVQGVTYNLSSNAILKNGTSLNVNSVTDNTYLSVTIAGVTRYLKLNVVQDGFTLTQNNLAIDGEVGYLNGSGIVDYKYNGTSIYSATSNYIQLTNFNVLYTNVEQGKLKLDEEESSETKFVYIYDIEGSDDDLNILTIEKTSSDWKFTRTHDKYAALSVLFDVVTKTQTVNCSVKFTSGIEYEYNASAWGETPKLYQGTKILLYEEVVKEEAFKNQALIKIRDKATKDIRVVDNSGREYTETLELSSSGEYTFNIKAGDDIIGSLSFTVVPNIVVKQDTATNLILDSGSNDVSTALYNNIRLYSYNTEDYVYGQTRDADNGNKIILYSTEFVGAGKTPILEDKTDDAIDNLKSSVVMQSKETLGSVPYVKTNGPKIETAWIDLIGAMQEVNVVVKSGNYEVGTFTAIVKNNNKVVTDGLTIASDNVLNLKAMLNYADKFKIEDAALKSLFNLSKIEWAYSDDHSNGTYSNTSSAIPTLNKRFDNVNLILTFEGSGTYAGKTLVFNGKTIDEKDLTINVIPFELEDSDNINKAYSEKQFNLLTDVYNTADIDAGKEIEDYFNYIKVLSVKDENGNDLTLSNLGVVDLEDGLNITFKKISGDSVKALIEYEVGYAGGLIYTYKKEITLQNWQALSVQYPENEVATDADKYLTIEEITLFNSVKYENIKYENIQYEAVVVDSLEGYTLDFKGVEGKFVNRVTAKDRTTVSAKFSTDYSIESLQILAYENTINLPNYINGDNISINQTNGKPNGTITFNVYSLRFSGIIVFRLTSTSGNFVDYFVKVTCLSNETNISGITSDFKNIEYKNNDNNAETTDDGKTISEIVKRAFINRSIDEASDDYKNNKSYLNGVFNVYDATKVKMFLLNATVLASDNKMFVGDIVNETIVGTVPDQIIYSGERYTDVGNCTLNINDYTTITLSLIYQDAYTGYVYPIGILTLYLRPNGAEILQNLQDQDTKYKLANEEGIENGEFKYTIPENTSSISFPTNFDVATTTDAEGNDDKHILNDKGELVTGIEGIEIGSNITIRNQVTSAKVFTVFYTKDGYTIKVTYTLNPVEIEAGSTITIGEFDKDLNKFVDTFIINEDNYKAYFGTYQGEIEIGNATFTVGAGYVFSETTTQTIVDGVTYSINSNTSDDIQDGALVLKFEQGLYDETKEIGVKYVNLSDRTKQNQTYIFNVKRGLLIEKTEGDNSGLNSSQRKTTETEETIDYTSDIGSRISIDQKYINGTDDADGVKYEFAGYKIYIKNASGKLNFTFGDDITPYITSDDRQAYTYNSETWASNWNKLFVKISDKYIKNTDNEYHGEKDYYTAPWVQAFTGSEAIGFVHMPNENKTIDVTFTISNGSDEFKTDASTIDVQTLYLKIAKTYQQVEAIYATKPGQVNTGSNVTYYYPEAENVIANDTIEKLQENLFKPVQGVASKLQNSIKLKLKNIKGEFVDINFSNMGFVNPLNPNFINFSLSNDSKATLTINGDYQNIRFDDSVTTNEKCIVYLDNIAGMPTAEYAFQIMADKNVDGFTFSNEGYPGDKNNDNVVDYMSFVIRKDENANAEYSTGKLKIGTINDGLSDGVHILDEAGNVLKYLPKAGSDDERILPFTNVSIEIAENSQGTHSVATINCLYDVILEMDPYNNANWDIYINFHRPKGMYHLPDMVTISLNIHGTSGYILNNLTIVLFNTEIGPKYEEGRQSVLGGETFDILNHSDYGLKVPTGVALSTVTFDLAYDLSMVGESGHSINTPLSSYKYDTNKNSLVEFDPATNMLTTKTVGKNVDINLVFKVNIGDYYLNNVTYQIQLRRSIQFFFNGDEPVVDKDGKWETNNVTSYATNFVLTNVDRSTNPQIIRNFDPEMKFSFNVSGDPMTIDGGKTYYFYNLLFELEDCVGGQAAGISIIKDPSKSNPDDSILKVDNEGITFYKDYTGKLYLTLTAGFRNGFNYTVSWTIDVFGILDIQPQNKTDNEGLTSSSIPYNSGQSVNLLNNKAGGTTGLYLKDMEYIGDSKLFDDYIDYDVDASNELQATYQYAIVKYDPYDGKNNATRFANADISNKSGENLPLTITDRKASVILPVVPRPGSEESYLVIYEVKINYLNNKELVYYVAYKVVNNLNISVTALKHGDNTSFDADNINVNTRLTTKGSVTTYLDLFKYSETYTYVDTTPDPDETYTYKIILTNVDNLGNATYQASENDGTFNAVQIEPTSNANQLRLSKDGGSTWITITKSTVTTETEKYWINENSKGTVDESDDIIENASLFTLNFNNITEFAKFIDDIDGIVIKQPTVEHKFKVVHIAEGRWGIDLTTKYKKLADGTFDENKDTADLFKNKLEDAEFIIRADSGQTIYSIDKYDAKQKTGFRMHTSKELNAAGSQKFNDLFVKETVTTGWLTYQYYDIIGVYGNTISSPAKSWVNVVENGSITTTIELRVGNLEDILDVTISVPTGTGTDPSITYTLQKVKYSVDGGGVTGICSLEQDFYVVYCEDYDAVYKMNLNQDSVELYKQGEDTIVNLRNYFVKYINNADGKLVIDDTAKVTAMNIISGANIVGEPNGNTYVIKEENLIAYRNANLTVGNDVTITYSATFGDVEMKISINYQLPSLSTVVAYQNSLDSNVGITSIYVPVYDEDGDMTYETLTSYLSNVTSIVENSSNYTAENGFIKDVTTEDYTGYIKLNKTTVDNYFNTHTTAKFLEIKYTITTRTENKSESMDFVIVVKKGDAPAVS